MEFGGSAGDGLDLAVAVLQFLPDLLAAALGQVWVSAGVVFDLVTGIGERLHRLRIFVHPLPHQKEGGFHVIATQNLDQLLRVLVAPGGIEGQRRPLFPVVLDVVDGQRSLGGGGAHGGGIADHAEHGDGRSGAACHHEPAAAKHNHFHNQ